MKHTQKTPHQYLDRLWFWGVLLIYMTLLGVTLFRHEPWNDEAQAWLLARDSGLVDLFTKNLRYEGSPGLWHLLLMIPSKSGLPFESIKIVSGIFAVFGICVFLRFAPFSKTIKTIFPFSYLILYQYAAVSRAYVLIPPVLFLLASIFPQRRKFPFAFLGLMVLLATTTLHGAVIACGIFAAHYIELFYMWKGLDRKERRQQIVSAGLFSLLLIFVALVLWVPGDYYLGRFRFDPFDFLQRTVLLLCDVLTANILFAKKVNIFNVLGSIASLIVWYLSLKWLWTRKMLKYLTLPGIPLALLFSVGPLNPWHTGVLFFLWLFVLWISFETKNQEMTSESDGSKQIVVISIILVLLVQVYWSYRAISYDWSHPYSGGPGVAAFIKTYGFEDKKIFARQLYLSSLNAYFDKNIIDNSTDSRRAFIRWDKQEPYYKMDMRTLIDEQPDILIIPSNRILGFYKAPDILNYEFVALFNGGVFWRDSVYKIESYLVYRKSKKLNLAEYSRRRYLDSAKVLGINDHLRYLIKTR